MEMNSTEFKYDKTRYSEKDFIYSWVIWELIFFFQRIEALSLYCFRWELSEDSGFKSYPSRPEVYLVKNVVR